MAWYKQAQKESSYFKQKDKDLMHNLDSQKGIDSTLFDVKRYNMDSYSIKIAISRTGEKYYVSLQTTHAFLGSVSYSEYWNYNLNEFKKASETYSKLINSIEDISKEFIEEEKPTSMYWAYIKQMCRGLDTEHQAKKNMTFLDYASRYEMEPDWRSNLYGKRYPVYMERNGLDHGDEIMHFKGKQQ